MQNLLNILTPYRLHIWLAVAVAIIAWFAWFHHMLDKAHKTDALMNSIATGNEQNAKSHTIGMDIDEGLNQYAKTKPPVVTTGPVFDADSVRRTQKRIRASSAARERGQGV